jgi:hypothetical protein
MLRLFSFVCILFGAACRNIDEINTDIHRIAKGINGIVAVENADQKVKLNFCSKGIDINTPFLI